MAKYKVVPVDPTPEMVEAAEEAHMPFGDMDLAIRMAILAAPDVQGEPVAYMAMNSSGYPEKCTPGDPRGFPVYATPQPSPDVSALVEALEPFASMNRYIDDAICTGVNLSPCGTMVHFGIPISAYRKAYRNLFQYKKKGGEA